MERMSGKLLAGSMSLLEQPELINKWYPVSSSLSQGEKVVLGYYNNKKKHLKKYIICFLNSLLDVIS